MSCIQGIRRNRRLTLARSTTSLIRSNVNPLIGYRGKARRDNELTLFINSADRDSSEEAALFRVKLPEGPHFPVNTVVKYQLFQANLPNYLYYFTNEIVTYQFTYSGVTYNVQKTFDGFYDMSNIDASLSPHNAAEPKDMTINDANYILTAYWTGNSGIFVLGFDRRTGKLFNQRSTPVTITVSSERGRIALGLPEGTLSYTLPGNPVKEPDDGSVVYDEKFKYFNNGSHYYTTATNTVYDFHAFAMPYPMQLIPTCLFVRLHETLETAFETRAIESSTTNTTRTDILAQIPVNAPFGTVITYQNADTFYEIPLKSECKEVYLGLYDEYNQLVNLHGFDWQCVLRIFWTQEDHGAR